MRLVLFIACVLILAAVPARAQCSGGSCPLPAAGWSSWSFELEPAPPEPVMVEPLGVRTRTKVKIIESGRVVRGRIAVREKLRAFSRVWSPPRPGVASGCVDGSCGR